MKKKILCTLALAATLAGAVSCGGSGEVKVGYNIFGKGGSTALDTLASQTNYVLSTLGDKVTEKNENWSADNIVTDIQALIDAGNKGVNIWGIAPGLIPVLAQKCNENKVYFTLNDKIPTDESVINTIKNYEYFAGAVAPDNASYGTAIGEYVKDQKWKKVLIVTTSDLKDPSDGPRINAFREAYADRTEVAEPVLNETPTQAKQNIVNALNGLTNNVPDVVYATSSDYAMAAVSALDEAGDKFANVKVVTSGLEDNILQEQNKDNSRIAFVNGDNWVAGYFSAVLLHNAVTGNVIKDSNGNKLWYDSVRPFTITTAEYDDYKKYFIDEQMYTVEETKAFAKTDYATVKSALDNYSFTNRINAKKHNS